MSNDTDFLARWSRRKHHAATDKIRQSKSESTSDDIVSGTSAALAQGESRLQFDPASLPTIESVGAETNISAFLEAGVPGDLARAALRRVWSLDPAIRDFVGLSENSWDFNAPGAMAGFGSIDGEEVGRLLTRLLGEPDTIAAAVHPRVISPLAEDSQKPAGEFDPVENQATNAESGARGQQLDVDEIDIGGDVAQQGRATAPQSELTPPECLSLALRHRHGGALPQLPSRKTADNSE
ncbi:hypothetical protein V1279_006549 [Bradyrhizobium sp. AZCC 1610]|uniref:DUF3306 domain-containing protein n=1 Tax=Bradyrhizobium sp. AZCC 1610 TaxID=3117020 RepID=UPI002FF08290